MCQPHRIAGIGNGVEQDGELISAEPEEHGVGRLRAVLAARERVVLAQMVVEAAADFEQDMIAGGSTHGFVEHLEVVDVGQQKRVGSGSFAGAREGALQPIEKEAAVGQTGQGIVKQVVFELLFGALALGDIAIHDHQFRDFALVVADGAGNGLENPPTAVLVLDAIFQTLSFASLTRLARGLENLEAIVGMDLFEGRSLTQFRGRVTENSFVCGTVLETSSLDVDQGNHVGGVLGDDLEQLLILSGLAMNAINPHLLEEDENGQRAERNRKPWQHAEFS